MHKKITAQNKQIVSKQLVASHLQTPLGAMLAVADETHLYMLKFTDQNNLQKSISSLQKITGSIITESSNNLLHVLNNELTAYFNGTLQQFSIPVQPYGTPFQQKSWAALLQIPYGATTSYGKQAIVVGNPKAFRAVANANKHNPIAIIIPCHRIIKSNGYLCGYNGGVHRKQALLELEQNN
ncbi:MAG: methylated-DNA--[protein]-cysteine S-methyltransferase [Candidatus Chromulinivorax sp.]|nr:methylated-DNA--[protein]-cysteine S-methyltransferase [Candidatus Chromulinivorax sp.]